MAKKSHADIMEKLSALKPSEPTKTRGKSPRKAPARKVKVKAAAPAKSPKPQTPPKPVIPSFRYPGFSVFGDPSKMYLGVYERWFKVITDANSMLSDYNNMLVKNLTSLWDLSKWRRY